MADLKNTSHYRYNIRYDRFEPVVVDGVATVPILEVNFNGDKPMDATVLPVEPNVKIEETQFLDYFSKSFVVSGLQLNELARAAASLKLGDSISSLDAFKEATSVSYTPPSEDWRKKWEAKTVDGDELVYVAPTNYNGETCYVVKVGEGRYSIGCLTSELIPKKPNLVKVELWAVIRKSDNTVHQIEEKEINAKAFLINDDRFYVVKLSGEYEATK